MRFVNQKDFFLADNQTTVVVSTEIACLAAGSKRSGHQRQTPSAIFSIRPNSRLPTTSLGNSYPQARRAACVASNNVAAKPQLVPKQRSKN